MHRRSSASQPSTLETPAPPPPPTTTTLMRKLDYQPAHLWTGIAIAIDRGHHGSSSKVSALLLPVFHRFPRTGTDRFVPTPLENATLWTGCDAEPKLVIIEAIGTVDAGAYGDELDVEGHGYHRVSSTSTLTCRVCIRLYGGDRRNAVLSLIDQTLREFLN
ncbi:hypothetical protein BDZ89DRAFT_1158516 [Hymenopellis radicata]|nr:hypothetical protein BDZ89DRAFT_1158516 [Hymenopellis radicata]